MPTYATLIVSLGLGVAVGLVLYRLWWGNSLGRQGSLALTVIALVVVLVAASWVSSLFSLGGAVAAGGLSLFVGGGVGAFLVETRIQERA